MPNRLTTVAAIFVGISCFAAFAPAWNAQVTDWDDPEYLNHPAATSVCRQTFTAYVVGNYHPLTMLTYAIEREVFGRNTRVAHMTNVVLHAITSALVVILLALLTQSTVAATAGGLFFAIHPLRVESVLWIAERKDVLFVMFFVAALVAYVVANRGRRGAIAFVWLFFLLSLLSKAVAVSLPVALLTIDYLENRLTWRAAKDKLPYCAVSIVFGLIAVHAQSVGGAFNHVGLPLFDRIAVCCSAIVLYLGKTFVPVSLSAYYSYPHQIGFAQFAAIGSVAAIVAIAAWSAKATRLIVFALAFFLVTVAVTLPIVSLGGAAAADRYTYLPSIGIALAVGVGVQVAIGRWRAASVIAAILGMVLFAATFRRSETWHNSFTLWDSVIEWDPSIPIAWNSRGVAYGAAGRDAEAFSDFSRAITLSPCYANALFNRAKILARNGRTADAQRDLQTLQRCHH